MSTKAFDKIAAGLKDALAIARGEEQPALRHGSPRRLRRIERADKIDKTGVLL
jgi:hypothetical protein